MVKLHLLLAVVLTASMTEYVSALGYQLVWATCFADSVGNRDNNLYDGGLYYAELGNSHALGSLSNGHQLRITSRGRSIVASKGDSGSAQKSKIDLHLNAVKALGYTSCSNFGRRKVGIESY